MKPTVGIIGGSGPLATLDIEQKILKETQNIRGVFIDQDYYNLVVLNYCSTPDRNDSFFSRKSDSLIQYTNCLLSIAKLGVDFILVACNTAHMYLPFLEKKTTIPILNMIEQTLIYIKKNFPQLSKIGLISTQATKEKRLYHELFQRDSIEIIDVKPDTQDLIMKAIYLIKAGVDLNSEDFLINNNNFHRIGFQQDIEYKSHSHKKIFAEPTLPNPKFIIETAIQELKRKGCTHIIFGCTELPLVIPYLKKDPKICFIDPNNIIAKASVELLMKLENQIEADNENYITKRKYV